MSMDLINYTPWPHLAFERDRADGTRSHVVVAQGTFAIASGQPLKPLPEQEDVQLREIYRGQERNSSLLRDTALATYKARADIHVNAVARAPEGRAATSWPVRVRVGEVCCDLEVRGPHEWRHRPVVGWQRGEPRPALQVPLSYEHAFGGSYTIDGDIVQEARNPAGTGFLPPGMATDEPVAAPQVVAVDEPSHASGKRYLPRGVGPMPPFFAPRTECVGTVDDGWLASTWPRVPRDWDDAYYNSAHPDLRYPGYPKGDEAIELVHLGAGGGTILSQLPGWKVYALLRWQGNHMIPVPMLLDTVHLDISEPDPATHRAYLCWRLTLPETMWVDRLELRMRRLDS